MYETHKTKDGNVMLIAQMDDKHLINTIKLKCRYLAECREQIEGVRDFEGSSLLSILNNKFSKENTIQQLSFQIKTLDAHLQPYVVEACLRGLKVSIYLKSAYGRSSAIPISNVKSLQSVDEYDDEDYDDDFDGQLGTVHKVAYEDDFYDIYENDPRCEPEYRH